MRTILFFLFLVVSKSLWGLTEDELKWKRDYYRLKAANMEQKAKTDSVFRVLYSISMSNPALLEELSTDFLNYSKKKNQVYGKAYLSKALSYSTGVALKQTGYYCKMSIPLLEKEKDSVALCFANQILAGVYEQSGNYGLAMKTNLKALRIAQKINNDMLIANTYNDLGLIMNEKRNYSTAKSYYFKALYYRKKSKDTYGIQSTCTNLGILYKNLRQYDSAFYFQRQSMQLAKSLNSTYSIAYAYNDLGVIHLKLHALDSAEIYFKKSVKLRKEIDEKWELGFTYNFLGELYRLRNNKGRSIEYLKAAVSLGEQSGNTKQIYESYQQLSLTFAKFKQYDSAFYYNQKFEQLKDSVIAQRNNLAAEMLIADYEFEKKQQEIKLLRNQTEMQALHIDTQRNWLWIAGLGFFSLIGFIVLFIRNRQLHLIRLQLESQQKEEVLRQEAQQKIHEDRQRISRELHDNIGANLTVFKELISEREHPDEASEIKQLTEETIQELRKSVWLLNREESTFEEWVIRLREYFKHLRKVRIQVYSPDSSNPVIHARVLTELFRVIQEGVNNALKHASCTEILITITNERNQLQISIDDNGIGIRESDLPGFGLINMKERINSISGEIVYQQSEGKGTSILISIPLMQTT
jgi:signal transduction histidine kinase